MNVRVIIKNDGKILLCYMKKNNFYFLPGGSVESNETSEEALFRELKEEMGVEKNKIIINSFIGFQEFKFNDSYGRDAIFSVSLKDTNIKSIEGHIDFVWKDLKDLKNLDLRPSIVIKTILENKTGYIV